MSPKNACLPASFLPYNRSFSLLFFFFSPHFRYRRCSCLALSRNVLNARAPFRGTVPNKRATVPLFEPSFFRTLMHYPSLKWFNGCNSSTRPQHAVFLFFYPLRTMNHLHSRPVENGVTSSAGNGTHEFSACFSSYASHSSISYRKLLCHASRRQ